MKKTILLIEDDAKVEARIKEVLAEFEMEKVSNAEGALDYLRGNKCDLIIQDYDLKGTDGLQLLRQVQLLAPRAKVIMLSVSNDIPLAVAATKMGVFDFLKKPIAAEPFRLAVEKALSAGEAVFSGPAESAWLQGENPALKKMYADIREALPAGNNLLLAGERGIDKEKVVEFIHAVSPKRKRKLRVIDLLYFRRENLEAHFWGTVQELLAVPSKPSLASEEDRCGTLYLGNIESLDDNFRASIFEYFKERKGNIDREVLAVIGVFDRGTAREGFSRIEIPPLRQRRDDLPRLLSHYLEFFAVKHDKNVRAISPELLTFFADYDFPGNYRELERMLEEGVLTAASEILDLRDVPLEFGALSQVSLREAEKKGRRGLEEVSREFEQDLYRVLISKTKGDVAAAARFLDVPRTALAERIEEFPD